MGSPAALVCRDRSSERRRGKKTSEESSSDSSSPCSAPLLARGGTRKKASAGRARTRHDASDSVSRRGRRLSAASASWPMSLCARSRDVSERKGTKPPPEVSSPPSANRAPPDPSSPPESESESSPRRFAARDTRRSAESRESVARSRHRRSLSLASRCARYGARGRTERRTRGKKTTRDRDRDRSSSSSPSISSAASSSSSATRARAHPETSAR